MQNSHQKNEYHVASFVVQASPENLTDIEERINQIEGAETHAVSPEGKIVFTIEDCNQNNIGKKIDELKYLQGVLSLAPVYHQFLPDEEKA